MSHPPDEEQLMSMREGMIFGGLWSIASVGWIAAILLVVTWVNNGWGLALFWFGFVLLSGAGIFFIAIVVAVVCEVLNVTTKKSRRDALNYFGWALLYNVTLGGLSVCASFASNSSVQ